MWAFEPTSSTAQFLAQGIAANAFVHVTLEQKAVSSPSLGAARSSHCSVPGAQSRSSTAQPSAGDSETVTLVTLDESMDRHGWTDIELIKMDAEGEENNIVKGGRRFFANLAPLVQYELKKDATNVNFSLIREFAVIGYPSYRLRRVSISGSARPGLPTRSLPAQFILSRNRSRGPAWCRESCCVLRMFPGRGPRWA